MVEGDDPTVMHQLMASATEQCVQEIRSIQERARSAAKEVPPARPRWPMNIWISQGVDMSEGVGWSQAEGSWRAHQIPILDPVANPAHLKLLEEWMRSYRPEELFDKQGALISELKDLSPCGQDASVAIRMQTEEC